MARVSRRRYCLPAGSSWNKRRSASRRPSRSDAYTVVWFEAANRLPSLLEDLIEVAGRERVAVVGRELTKVHEEIRRGPLGALLMHYQVHPPLGEVTLALAGAPEVPREAPGTDTIEAIQAAVRTWLAEGESRREVVRRVTAEFGLPRNDAYRLVMDT